MNQTWKIRSETLQHNSKGERLLHDGEPWVHELTNWPNDRSLRTTAVNECCGCGLTHTYSYEVFKEPKANRFHLVIRATVDESTRPKPKRRKK